MVKVKILSQRRNEILKREEVTFMVDHEKNGTPSYPQLREQLSAVLKADVDRVYVKKLETKTGSMVAIGEVNVYDSDEQAKRIEYEYIILRNTQRGKEKEGGE